MKGAFGLLALALALAVGVSVASAGKQTYSLNCDATATSVTWPSGTFTVTFTGTDTSGHVGTPADPDQRQERARIVHAPGTAGDDSQLRRHALASVHEPSS